MERSFSRLAIDLALEQTVNRDASLPMRGIVGFHYSLNAIRRWCITSTQSGMSATGLRRLAGLETIEHPAMQLRVSIIEKDSHQRDALFSSPASSSAFPLNIATGRAASQETQEYFTGSLVSGHQLHVKFHEECAAEEEIPKKKGVQVLTGPKFKEEASHSQRKTCC